MNPATLAVGLENSFSWRRPSLSSFCFFFWTFGFGDVFEGRLSTERDKANPDNSRERRKTWPFSAFFGFRKLARPVHSNWDGRPDRRNNG